jgi:hypothetical protein
MASKKLNMKSEATGENPETDEQENEAAEGESDEQDPIAEEVTGENPETTSIEKLTAIKTEGIHERLEDLELSMMTASQDKSGAFNRVTLLTGALKTSLPEVIKHVENAALKADLEGLFGIL